MQEDQIREALNAHWEASAAGDVDAEHNIYAEDAICDYPQSGERIVGRLNLQTLRGHHPVKLSGIRVERILGRSDVWIAEIHHHLPRKDDTYSKHYGISES